MKTDLAPGAAAPPAPSWSPRSVPDIVDVHWVRGAHASIETRPSLLVEVAHGATAAGDFERLAVLLDGPLPEGLIDFFHVNTDRGAFELACAVAAQHVASTPEHAALVVRCRVPRTFVDCNRDLSASAADFQAGGVPPGMMPWVVGARDQALLRARHAAYVATVSEAMGTLRDDGVMLLAHSYSPYEVDATVDMDIVPQLRAAYAPGVVEGWPVRAPIDVIGRDLDGVQHTPAGFLEALSAECAAREVICGDSATYRLHPSTMAWHYAARRPGRVVCVEVRRDLLSPGGHFEPFDGAPVDPVRVNALAEPIARALACLWPGPAS